MNIRQQASELLRSLPDSGVLIDIHEGRVIPCLTDYYLQPLPEEWNSPPPLDLVGGRTLIPAFKDGDSYSIYCIEPQTGRIFDIDIEAPWPPDRVFESCLDFKTYLFQIVTEEKPDEVKNQLRAFLEITGSQP